MGKPKRKITNWKQYNEALVNRGSVTFWLDETALNA
ncbi:IS5/IS1182 family transposase, partial [Vibrio sp. 10N.222.55.E8]